MVEAPGKYPWSSNAANALGGTDPLITPHPQCLALSTDAASRQAAYRDWVTAAVLPEEPDLIRARLQRQHALHTDRFRTMIEDQLQRRAGPARIGRPSKQKTGPM